MTRKTVTGIFLIMALFAFGAGVSAQGDFAASLEVLNPGVEVQRVNTTNPISVSVEAIVGVGDVIRTDDTGQARITFFADGTDVTLEPETEYIIVEFGGDDDDFRLLVEVIAGQTTHRLNRILGANSSYDVRTPGMTLAARGTEFAIRVEADGRSAMLVRGGDVNTETPESSADVPAEFGVRSEVDAPLSDVVRASTFAELDSALDGCAASVTTPDDVSINVRLGPSTDLPRIGIIDAETVNNFGGTSATGDWYRITFAGGFGWILSTTAQIQGECAGLRVFEDTHIEDAESYDDTVGPIDFEPPAPPETDESPTDDAADEPADDE